MSEWHSVVQPSYLLRLALPTVPVSGEYMCVQESVGIMMHNIMHAAKLRLYSTIHIMIIGSLYTTVHIKHTL
jgi:hypothetical protein